MKRFPIHALYLVAVFTLAVAIATSGEMAVKFRPIDSWQQALDLAKAENKYLFVDAYTDWCGWCKVMDRETFTNEDVGKIMNDKFVPVKIEMESTYGIDLAMRYGVRSFPTFLVLASDGRLVQRLFGYEPPEEFLNTLNKMLDPATQNPEPGYSATAELKWPEFMRSAFLKGKDRKRPDTAVVNAWLRGQKDWSTPEVWGVIVSCYPQMANDYVMEKRKELGSKYGYGVVRYLEEIASGKLMKAAKDKNESGLTESVNMLRQIKETDITGDSLGYTIYYYKAVANWSKVASTLVDAARSGRMALSNINTHAWDMYEKCNDKAALVQATDAMNIALQKNTGGYEEQDTYAALLYKTACYPQAEAAAAKAIEMGKAKGQDVKATEELLSKIRESEKPKN